MSDSKSPLTTGGAARVLDRSSDMVRVYERTGRLRAIKTANGIRLFDRGEVERLAQELKNRGTRTR